MKLTLNQDHGIQILTAAGAIERKHVEILKAGVGKLIRDGKNQIIIEVGEPSIPDELIRELMGLDLVARELSGRLVVLAPRTELRTKLENFARPMTLAGFGDRAGAFDFFDKINAAPLGPIQPGSSAAASSAPTQAAFASAPAAAVAEAAPAVAEEQVKQLKEDIRQRELKELGQLRETIVRLENENKALLEQFQTYFLERKIPPDERAFRQRIAELEAKLERFMDEAGKEKGK